MGKMLRSEIEVEQKKKEFVVSGINIFEGGALSVYKEFLNTLISENLADNYNITIFVHNKGLFSQYADVFRIVEKPLSRKSYIFRLYYEYIYFYFYSLRANVDTWFSIHDITPSVRAKKRYVYCHNPSPFLRRTGNIWKVDKILYLMSFWYKYLYQINIKKNTAVIVQQDWLRQEFVRLFGIDAGSVIVAKPDVKINKIELGECHSSAPKNIFLYPSYPRSFKNFEVLCEACRLLETESPLLEFEVWITIDGSENKYANDIRTKFTNIKSIRWLGIVKKEEMQDLYTKSSHLVFPSLLETWGLPLTEYKAYEKPIICSDLPYAHETIGSYHAVAFFDPNNASDLADIMRKVCNNSYEFVGTQSSAVVQPFANGWKALVRRIC